jgi:AraC-like DNA-binding protein
MAGPVESEVVELNIPSPRRKAEIEDCFRCRLVFDAPQVGIGFASETLAACRRSPEPERPTTFGDVRRARSGAAPSDLAGVVRELLRVQIRSRAVSLDAAARALGFGTRRLKRSLDRKRLSFREITRGLREETAKELLIQTSAPVSAIGLDLGYLDPAHFARAFNRDVGCSPSAYRARFAGAGTRAIGLGR